MVRDCDSEFQTDGAENRKAFLEKCPGERSDQQRGGRWAILSDVEKFTEFNGMVIFQIWARLDKISPENCFCAWPSRIDALVVNTSV